MSGICQQIILHPNDGTYDCNFLHVYSFHKSDLKITIGLKRVKKGQSEVKKRYQINMPIVIPFIYNFLYTTYKPYRTQNITIYIYI